ncbi:MAG: LuxR C-terminal-related transcriptional regulator, partial [Planctomycetaceae bacterium]
REDGLNVVAIAHDGDSGMRVVLESRPEVVVLDVNFPGKGAFEVAQEISAQLPLTRIVFLTGFLSDIFIEQALRNRNTRAYVLKGESFDVFIGSIRRAAAGEYTFSKDVEDRVSFRESDQRYIVQSECRLNELTDRQIEVLRHLAGGESVKEVARRLNLSEKSVDSHKYRIMHKLGIHDRVGLARYAIREGLMLP